VVQKTLAAAGVDGAEATGAAAAKNEV